VTFGTSREGLASLGEPAYIETDGARTAGPPEYFWGFETPEGLRLQICWTDPYDGHATVHADPPDAAAAIAALRALGLRADFEARPLPKEAWLPRRHARGAVWLFLELGRAEPAAVFSRKQLADAWLAKSRKSGALIPYPLDLPLDEAAKRMEGLPGGERYEYVEGVQRP
jgi:hypothetical protein